MPAAEETFDFVGLESVRIFMDDNGVDVLADASYILAADGGLAYRTPKTLRMTLDTTTPVASLQAAVEAIFAQADADARLVEGL